MTEIIFCAYLLGNYEKHCYLQSRHKKECACYWQLINSRKGAVSNILPTIEKGKGINDLKELLLIGGRGNNVRIEGAGNRYKIVRLPNAGVKLYFEMFKS